jgi:hypothetical protein
MPAGARGGHARRDAANPARPGDGRSEETDMTSDDELMDPTDSVAVPRKNASRPATLDGTVITLLDISKARGDHLLDRVEELLRERARPRAILRRRKPTFARPAPDELRQAIVRESDLVIEALAD